ncbi:SDR family oxidoreductase [Actinobacteria bacterium YIM 96077]|uniref:NAD(P)-dependent dehydrogenase n=1 Tax=Phytoactinopolyspora halophila TaxID=1981511 RepID=A0A329QTI2_9ACTN|nr:SDR family oxidoreductase [Phytoactinopolyspora halophila]AYY13829.1 SDR family oxidoreductase [Actinobacteria bacterium YIM 96077]RAW15627.1 NAD(P)-dependent dehydrogenase [Phytoactinopolyspora halophila]
MSPRTDHYPREFPAQQQEPPGLTDAMDPRPDHGEDSYRGTGRLTGMRALITGGDSGIGRAIAIAYAREGADVAISYLPEEHPDGEATAALVSDAGRRVVTVPGDLTDRRTCLDVAERALSELDGVNILVNNAGFQMARSQSIEEVSAEQLDRVVGTNFTALFWLTQALVPHLSAGDCIINNSSIQAYDPSGSLLDYAATKSAINNFTVNLAAELGPRGVRVNAVAPGPIWTPLQPATQPVAKVEKFGQDTPFGRAGQPVEVAPAFVFLASPTEASYVSGTILGVTGGKPVF